MVAQPLSGLADLWPLLPRISSKRDLFKAVVSILAKAQSSV